MKIEYERGKIAMFENGRKKVNSLNHNVGVDGLPAKKKIALVCCSNGLPVQAEPQIRELVRELQKIDLEPVLSPYIYASGTVEAGTACQRAESLMACYRDPEIAAIYDVSGGDIANEILPYLDYEMIARADKMFWGYSDLTTVINAIYAKTGIPSVLYQIKNMVKDSTGEQEKDFHAFANAVYTKKEDADCEGAFALFQFPYEFVQGDRLEGVVLGGNIRCLLKLAGTPYWPDMTDKILFLEARSGGVAQMTAYLSQLQQLGVFDQVRGILLGTFTQMEREQQSPEMTELVRRFIREGMPVVRTSQLGHGANSKAIVIGETLILE